MKKIKQHLINWLDPYQQSFLFFKWNIVQVIGILGLAIWLTYAWKSGFVKILLDNVFVYLPNYLTHEMLGHNLVGNIFFRIFYTSSRELGEWLLTLAGNGVETLVPFLLIFSILRVQGGRWLLPPTLYWLATTLYAAGVYAQDARTCSMALTSSDMMTDYKPGEICGDWHHILEPIGLLEYDQWFAYTFLFLGCLTLVLALYSAWYYWTHPDFYNKNPQLVPDVPEIDPHWQPSNVYNPQQENLPGGRNQ